MRSPAFIALAASLTAACSVVGNDLAPRRDATARVESATGDDVGPPTRPPARPPEGEDRPEPTPTLAGKVLSLQPLGEELSTDAVDLVVTALVEFYGFQVDRASPRPLPPTAYYPPRKRYRAEKLLGHLAHGAPEDAFRVLGLTAVDISTTKGRYQDWGIMGLATLDGRVAVMSMFRCRRGSRSPAHARERLGKVAVHEVGHTLGLEHCPTRGCLMEDARGTNTTTDREYVLCPRCRRYLEQQGIVLPPNPSPPWPRP